MAYEFGFLFGKTIMDPQDLDRWLKVDDFTESIRNLVSERKPIGDTEVLQITERILNENLNSDMICGVKRQKLAESVVKLRSQVSEYTFKPAWLKEKFPGVWSAIRSKINNENLVVMPVQMCRYIQVLKYILNLEDLGTAEVYVYGIDAENVGHATASFKQLSITGSRQTDELFGRLRFCDSIDIEINDERIEVLMTVSNLMVKESDLGRSRKAWVLQWNQDLKSKMNQGDGKSNGKQ